MRIKLHLMGPLKPKIASRECPGPNSYLEVDEATTPRDLMGLLGVEEEEVLALINGKPVSLDERIEDEDRVVLMYPDSKEA